MFGLAISRRFFGRDALTFKILTEVSLRGFHNTPKRYVHPVILLLSRVVPRATYITVGRLLRIGWQKMDSDKKKYYKKKYFHNPLFLATSVGVIAIGGGIFYYSHLQDTPITNRRRFLALTKQQVDKLSNVTLQDILKQNEEKSLEAKSELHTMVFEIIKKLVDCNNDIEQVKSQDWILHVIDDNIVNAYVLSNGHIFVHSGLLKVAANDDQLAFVLGHEMAHAILNHSAEKLGLCGVLEAVSVIMLAMVWALVPVDLAILVDATKNKITKVLLALPHERLQELEADEVGLLLAAKACYDVRQSSIFVTNSMVIEEAMSESSKKPRKPELLSTHPSYENRVKELDKFIPKAMMKRTECKCPELKGRPQSLDLVTFKKLLKEMKPQSPAQIH